MEWISTYPVIKATRLQVNKTSTSPQDQYKSTSLTNLKVWCKSTRLLQINKTSTSQQDLQIQKSDVSQLDCYWCFDCWGNVLYAIYEITIIVFMDWLRVFYCAAQSISVTFWSIELLSQFMWITCRFSELLFSNLWKSFSNL